MSDPWHHHAVNRMFGRDALYMLGFALQFVAAGLVTPLVTRVSSSATYGVIAASFAVMQVCVVLAGLGLNLGIQRAYARQGPVATRALLGAGIFLAVGMTSVLTASVPLWSRSVGLRHAQASLALAILWAGLGAATGMVLAYLRSQDRLAVFNVMTVVQSVGTQLAGVVTLLLFGRTAPAYFVGVVAAQLAAFLLGALATRPTLGRAHLGALSGLLAFSLGVLPLQISNFVLSSSDRLVISAQLGAADVGRYQVAYNLAAMGIVLVGLMNIAWLPSLLRVPSTAGLLAALSASRDRMAAATVPVAMAVSAICPVVLALWAPRSYHPRSLALVVTLVVASTVPALLAALNWRLMMVRGRTHYIAVGSGIAAAINVALNLVLDRPLGLGGAALSTLVAYLVLWGLSDWLLGRLLGDGELAAVAGPRDRRLAASTLLLAVAATFGCVAWALPPEGGWGLVARALSAVVLAVAGAWTLLARGSHRRVRHSH